MQLRLFALDSFVRFVFGYESLTFVKLFWASWLPHVIGEMKLNGLPPTAHMRVVLSETWRKGFLAENACDATFFNPVPVMRNCLVSSSSRTQCHPSVARTLKSPLLWLARGIPVIVCGSCTRDAGVVSAPPPSKPRFGGSAIPQKGTEAGTDSVRCLDSTFGDLLGRMPRFFGTMHCRSQSTYLLARKDIDDTSPQHLAEGEPRGGRRESFRFLSRWGWHRPRALTSLPQAIEKDQMASMRIYHKTSFKITGVMGSLVPTPSESGPPLAIN